MTLRLTPDSHAPAWLALLALEVAARTEGKLAIAAYRLGDTEPLSREGLVAQLDKLPKPVELTYRVEEGTLFVRARPLAEHPAAEVVDDSIFNFLSKDYPNVSDQVVACVCNAGIVRVRAKDVDQFQRDYVLGFSFGIGASPTDLHHLPDGVVADDLRGVVAIAEFSSHSGGMWVLSADPRPPFARFSRN